MSIISINIDDNTPIYRQIISQVISSLLNSSLEEGDPLPSIRQLANDLELNPNTVAKSYKILERDNIIKTARSKGTFIAKDAIKNIHRIQQSSFESEIVSLVNKMRDSGLSNKEIFKIIKSYIAG